MTAKTRKLFAIFGCVGTLDVLSDFRVAFATSVIGDLSIVLFNLDWLVEPSRCEGKRMPEAIRGFRRVLGEKSCWCMAVVAGGNGAM